MGNDRYGGNRQYVMILLKCHADKNIEGVYKVGIGEYVFVQHTG